MAEKVKQDTQEKQYKIIYTGARDGISGSFAMLSDYEWQIKSWLNPNAAHRFSDSLDLYCFETLIGHHHLDEIETARIEIGFTLYDDNELEYLSNYCLRSFSFIVNEIGETEPDAAYYKHAEWPKVVYGALMCRRYMAANNMKHEFWREFAQQHEYEYIANNPKDVLQMRDKYFLDLDVAAYMHKHWPGWQLPK